MTREQAAQIPDELRRPCPECGGGGELTTSHRFTCYGCQGRGWVPAPGVEELLKRTAK